MVDQREQPPQTHYDTLGVRPTATRGQIRLAYLKRKEEIRSLAGGATQARRIDEAFEVLLKESEREAYDYYLAKQSRERPEVAVQDDSQRPARASTVLRIGPSARSSASRAHATNSFSDAPFKSRSNSLGIDRKPAESRRGYLLVAIFAAGIVAFLVWILAHAEPKSVLISPPAASTTAKSVPLTKWKIECVGYHPGVSTIAPLKPRAVADTYRRSEAPLP